MACATLCFAVRIWLGVTRGIRRATARQMARRCTALTRLPSPSSLAPTPSQNMASAPALVCSLVSTLPRNAR